MVDRMVFDDTTALAAGAATFIIDAAREALQLRRRFTIALCGGSTPKPVYEALAREPYASAVDWSGAVILFGDERCVPPDDERSNYRMARGAWFDATGIPERNILRMRGEDDPVREALRYEQELASLFRTTGPPVIDFVLLGMGANGHTASLFPGTAALRVHDRWVVAQYVEVVQSWRLTLTEPVINNARDVAFLVAGADKSEIVRNVNAGPFQPDVWPAQLVRPVHGRLTWLLDADASASWNDEAAVP
jgi:6-phosphogluconolactonase